MAGHTRKKRNVKEDWPQRNKLSQSAEYLSPAEHSGPKCDPLIVSAVGLTVLETVRTIHVDALKGSTSIIWDPQTVKKRNLRLWTLVFRQTKFLKSRTQDIVLQIPSWNFQVDCIVYRNGCAVLLSNGFLIMLPCPSDLRQERSRELSPLNFTSCVPNFGRVCCLQSWCCSHINSPPQRSQSCVTSWRIQPAA